MRECAEREQTVLRENLSNLRREMEGEKTRYARMLSAKEQRFEAEKGDLCQKFRMESECMNREHTAAAESIRNKAR